MNSYDVNTVVQLQAVFADLLGNAINPQMVKLVVTDPTGAKTVAISGMLNPATGTFTYRVDAAIPGLWSYQFEGLGNVEGDSPTYQFAIVEAPPSPGQLDFSDPDNSALDPAIL